MALPSQAQIVIVGGGISGLATAYYLTQRGLRPTLIEQALRLGGMVHTETIQGNRIENGPDSFLLNKTAAVDLIREIGLEGELLPRNEALHATYIWKQGRMQPLPEGLSMMIPTRVMPMLRAFPPDRTSPTIESIRIRAKPLRPRWEAWALPRYAWRS